MHQLLLERLKDERSKRVIFVSHCLLNENTRYLGGAFRRGCADKFVDALQPHPRSTSRDGACLHSVQALLSP
jgi:hypothetical protein